MKHKKPFQIKRYKPIFTLIIYLFLAGKVFSQNEHTIEIFGVPEDFYIVNDSTLLVYDPQRNNEEVCLFSIITGEYPSCVRNGRGPGEISGNLMRFYINQNKGEIYIWDGGSRRLSLFDNDLQYKQTISLPKTNQEQNLSPSYRIPLGNGDEFLVNSFQRGVFGNFYTASEMELTSLPITSNLIEPAKTNPFLLQGKYTVDWSSNSIIQTSDFSSLILKINNAEVDYITLGEPNLPFPENKDNYELVIPNVSAYTFSSMDASIDDNFIYILHSGKKTKKREVFWYYIRGRFDELTEELQNSQSILIYDLETGAFMEKITLDEEVYRAKVFNGILFTLKRGKEDAFFERKKLP